MPLVNIKSEEGIFEISNSVLRGKISNGLWGETDYRVGAGIEKHSALFCFFFLFLLLTRLLFEGLYTSVAPAETCNRCANDFKLMRHKVLTPNTIKTNANSYSKSEF